MQIFKKKKNKKKPICAPNSAWGVSLLKLVGKGDNIPMKLRAKYCGKKKKPTKVIHAY
jgi:hypothetical protein